jgi:16S rRNA processing protein RimM
MSLVRIGRLGRAHGLAGELYLYDCDLSPESLREIGTFVWRGARGIERSLTLSDTRSADVRLLVRFAGITSREDAAELTNGSLMLDEAQLPDAGPGEAYQFQLIGLEVHTADGRLLGTVAEAFPTGAHWVYVVRGERELMIPAHAETILNVDLDARRMTVALPAGLEEAQ